MEMLRTILRPHANVSRVTCETLVPAAAGLQGQFDALLSVEQVGIYKPAPAVYDLVLERFAAHPGQVLFVSSNGWDVAGAAAFGFRTLWVNRAGLPVDRLPQRPAHIAPDLTRVTDFLA